MVYRSIRSSLFDAAYWDVRTGRIEFDELVEMQIMLFTRRSARRLTIPSRSARTVRSDCTEGSLSAGSSHRVGTDERVDAADHGLPNPGQVGGHRIRLIVVCQQNSQGVVVVSSEPRVVRVQQTHLNEMRDALGLSILCRRREQILAGI